MPGSGEILFVLLVVLLLFGGKELPRVARMLGKWSSVLRKSMNEVRQELNRIAIAEELKEAGKELKGLADFNGENIHQTNSPNVTDSGQRTTPQRSETTGESVVRGGAAFFPLGNETGNQALSRKTRRRRSHLQYAQSAAKRKSTSDFMMKARGKRNTRKMRSC